MKKTGSLITAVLALGTLTCFGCGDDGLIRLKTEGGTAEEADAIFQTVNNYDIAAVNGSTNFNPNEKFIFKGDTFDYLRVTTKQTIISDSGRPLTVNLTWEGDENSFESTYDTDAKHIRFDFHYSDFGGADKVSVIKLTKLTCGGCSTVDGQFCTFTCNLSAQTLQYDEYSIAQLNKVTDNKYDILDYTLKTKKDETWPWFKVNYDQTNMYVKTHGQVIYTAPDGNWALIADGNNVLEIYAGSGEGRKLYSKEYPALKVGEYVTVWGNMGQYMGNIQLTFIYRVLPLENGAVVSQSTAIENASEITESDISGFTINGTKHKQVIENMMNSIKYVEGTYVANSLKNGSNKTATSITTGSRYYFRVKVGSEKQLEIAFDYHVTQNNESANNLIQKLNQIVSNPNTTFRICGTVRYSDGDSGKKNDFNHFYGDQGQWTITPFDGNMITVAD